MASSPAHPGSCANPDVDGNALLGISLVSKRFGTVTAVDRLSLDIGAGEFFALLGPSGCGKTTLLRMLAGFQAPDEGQIYLGNHDIAQVPPHERPVNMMFQNYALFPHLDVAGNIAFGLKRAALPRQEIETRVAEMIALTRLTGLETRRPHQLSGGQRQRVALARSIARRPKLLLLDEPMAALDRKLRETTQGELKTLQRKLGMTFIIVTHDQDEAMVVADRIGVMNAGRLAQVGTPRELYNAPNSRWIADFVGDINLIEGVVADTQDGFVRLQTKDAGQIAVATEKSYPRGAALAVALRPEVIQLEAGSDDSGAANRLSGTLVDSSYLGAFSLCRIRLPSGFELRVRRAGDVKIATGQPVALSFPVDAGVLLEA